MQFKIEEVMIAVISRLLEGVRHVAVGNASPIPGSASLLAEELSAGSMRVSMLGSGRDQFWTDGGVELFDCAGQGRIDAFFLGGGQIDGQANINLVGVGDYPQQKVRWSGSFGSAYLYFVVPRVILFRDEHTRRVMVDEVDFISAPGVSEENIYRRGGPQALVTPLCHFSFEKDKRCFKLESVHPGHTVEEVKDNTGFDFDCPASVPETPLLDTDTTMLLRQKISPRIAKTYPKFAKKVFGVSSN
jgi:glutaconate CoA-transferase, subunit B